ncbi:MAG: helix-turn-helix domain-containing protein [Saprospiraceae bacterium]
MNTRFLEPETTLQSEDLHVLHRQIELSDNARLILTTGYSAKPELLTHIVPQLGGATVGFNFCVRGSANFFNKGKYSPARSDEQFVNHILFPRAETSCHLEVEGQFAHIMYCIGKDRYFNLLDSYADLQPKGFLRAAEMPGYCFFNKNQWTPAFRHVTNQLLQNQMTGLSGKLFFESKMLEITALLMEAYREKPIEFNKPDRHERDKMQHVRELLEQNLSDPPSLARLARLAGTNEFALKKNFKEIFGVPVFKFLQQLRLDKAHQLFNSTDMQVGEVAMEVGYDSVSAFSRAFKDRFGVQPQLVR